MIDYGTYGKSGRIFLEFIEGNTLQHIDVVDLSNTQMSHKLQLIKPLKGEQKYEF